MTQDEVLRSLEEHNAIIRNTHVVYTSGRHGDTYINKDAIYPDTVALSALCGAIAEHFDGRGIDIVASPAVGGVVLAQWTAYHLTSKGNRALAVYAEKDPSSVFTFRRGYDKLLRNHKVLVVEDILTTGGSARAVVDAARGALGRVIGVSAICNRGGVSSAQVGSPEDYFVLSELTLQSWEENECPLCLKRVPINLEVGKGKEYLARLAQR
ncbi:MAG TPA: phosphoribosyltransferase family protein [Methylomirabilota bacterium]|nr:phosphoribosyltransferase family protein [Methylomirabilota bacterium]